MPIFYRGAGIGTYWHTNDATKTGFTPKSTAAAQPALLMGHIARGSVTSPYISLTSSWGVALSYAVGGGRVLPSRTRPAYVYELSINTPLPAGLQLIDPVKELAKHLNGPFHNPTYQHDGLPEFLLGVVHPRSQAHMLSAHYPQPPGSGGTPRPPNLSMELETLVRALRDSEILAIGNIPSTLIVRKHNVY